MDNWWEPDNESSDVEFTPHWWKPDKPHKYDGKRVRIKTEQSCYKKYHIVGELGTVVNWRSFENKAAIQLDNKTNNSSGKGYFYMNKHNIEFLEEENMNKIENYLNIATIKFVDEKYDKTYQYANFDLELRPGNLCVVMSANHGMGLAKVVDITARNDIALEREIVAIVNTEAYDFRVDQRKKAAELKAKMQERAKKLQDVALFQMLAKDDPEMAELLAAYQGIASV